MVNAVQNAESRHAAAERFDVAPSPVIKLMQAFEATGSHEPKRMGGYKTFKLAGHEALVCGLIAEVPDATLDELVARLRKAPVSARQGSRPAAPACGGFWTVSASVLKKDLARQRTGPAGRSGGAARIAAKPAEA